jgi:GPH family glycoside/pentoside/hexuronide:cation symporter/probable glucitol transport protein GutA
MFGIIADKTKSRWGRYRPYLLFATPLLALFQVLTFTNLNISTMAKGIWCLVTYVLCGMAYTAVSISTASLGSVISSKSHERVTLMSFRGVMATMHNYYACNAASTFLW